MELKKKKPRKILSFGCPQVSILNSAALTVPACPLALKITAAIFEKGCIPLHQANR